MTEVEEKAAKLRDLTAQLQAAQQECKDKREAHEQARERMTHLDKAVGEATSELLKAAVGGELAKASILFYG